MPNTTPKKLTHLSDGSWQADSPFDDGEANVIFGTPKKFGKKAGPGWLATRFRSLRHPAGFYLALSADVDTITTPMAKKNDPLHGEYLEVITNKKKNGKNQVHGAKHCLYTDGSVEYQVTWDVVDDVPDYLDVLIDSPAEITWHKQLALTPEEIDAGMIRPDNVVNSYALYIPYSGRIMGPDGSEQANYLAGKFGHLYRSWLQDANGQKIWIDQTAPIEAPPRLRMYLMSDPATADWIRNAAFPLTCGPTFGYTATGASDAVQYANYQYAKGPFTPASSGSASSVSVYAATGDGSGVSITQGFWLDSSGSPGALVKDTGNTSYATSNTWWTQNLDASASISSGSSYWIGSNFTANGGVFYNRYDTVANFAEKLRAATYSSGSLSDPWGTAAATYTSVKCSCYVTYTAAGGNARLFGGILSGGQLIGGKLVY